ncbi:unnamed protein product [Rodentolepis nana]|uniref:Uncharacterized protein n=1 Tax=Rodentolepis nana TaxID=102285 RepID=A0A0R3THR7_RODNA|nr:unnamed protein product [Rodentolepis nana]
MELILLCQLINNMASFTWRLIILHNPVDEISSDTKITLPILTSINSSALTT